MKKILTAISIATLLGLALAGCGKEDTDINKALGSEEMTVTPTKVTREKAATDRKNILKIAVKVKNNSKTEIGIGAGNFRIKDDNRKVYDSYGMKKDSLGQVVAPGETITGNIYFEVPAILEKVWLEYDVSMDREPAAEWLLAFPTK
ncbi:DUF4352 domain-containing protein [Listeria booriae]|uniref:DUF4352 domain-containing protein n=1 Tax=Listeria booriae TaxID=1552123 RepID=A0A7X0XKW5_9LIST|nr:DUF4352 domain-containing protein [Listeria booriae]MBC1332629.1 DUF4352 domain-containing protein [Listeria booriae]MBC1562939.1 DUF4352 domain-containing protein [Listeria booriae]MBC1889646.1 DUF4352 domain-containing protein [Listeria booriae]MBC1907430.1 DUF4352 domain-containing protein [Listeria booriae]MBC2005353.1 DUF4352 domain-containing protein [Listeria booriae]